MASLSKRLPLLAVLLVVSMWVGIGVYKLLNQPNSGLIVSPEVSLLQATPETKLPPTAIKIPKLNLNIPVQAALVHDNKWDMFDHSASWLSTSAVPGEGNVILYAHDRKQLFGNLYQLKPGDLVEVYQHNKWISYKVTESKAVSDKDIGAILSDNNQLTLYTCEGTFDQKRRVVYALPID